MLIQAQDSKSVQPFKGVHIKPKFTDFPHPVYIMNGSFPIGEYVNEARAVEILEELITRLNNLQYQKLCKDYDGPYDSVVFTMPEV